MLPSGNKQLSFGQILPFLSNQSWLQKWDAASSTPYLVEQHKIIRTADGLVGREIWYDDPTSLRLKVEMAKSLGVQNFGVWTADALDYTDKSVQAMWGALV